MDLKDFTKIQDTIKKAELENTKLSIKIEDIKKEWNNKYGFNSLDEAKSKLQELESKQNELNKRVSVLYDELVASQDWDELQRMLDV